MVNDCNNIFKENRFMLPRIVVVGAAGCGVSSVVEAITGFSPKLRKSLSPIEYHFEPKSTLSGAVCSINGYHKTLLLPEQLEDVGSIINDQAIWHSNEPRKVDPIIVKISAPTVPRLSVVDLPYHASHDEIVLHYLRQKAIIVVVQDSENDIDDMRNLISKCGRSDQMIRVITNAQRLSLKSKVNYNMNKSFQTVSFLRNSRV